MRLRKKPHTFEKLENFSDFVTVKKIDSSYAGNWKKLFGNENQIFVELGTGKGDFISQLAEKNPQINFIGLEMEPTVILAAARKVQEKKLSNVKLFVFDINNIEEIFSENEIDRIYINFCDPWSKKRHAKRRLTYITFLQKYKKILVPNGEIHFKTDNRGLFDFSLEQFELANFKVRDISYDLHANEPPENIRTEYENRFSAAGVPINRCVVTV